MTYIILILKLIRFQICYNFYDHLYLLLLFYFLYYNLLHETLHISKITSKVYLMLKI